MGYDKVGGPVKGLHERRTGKKGTVCRAMCLSQARGRELVRLQTTQWVPPSQLLTWKVYHFQSISSPLLLSRPRPSLSLTLHPPPPSVHPPPVVPRPPRFLPCGALPPPPRQPLVAAHRPHLPRVHQAAQQQGWGAGEGAGVRGQGYTSALICGVTLGAVTALLLLMVSCVPTLCACCSHHG